MSSFDLLAPFIQEYIYRNKWVELRDVQVAAIDVLFHTDNNLLLASGTASGKTEAAFLPVISLIYKEKIKSVSVLYISPLKALINDQFERLNDLLAEADIPVTKWHGDASVSGKDRLRRAPRGIMQTTPESLEAMLCMRQGEVRNLFSDLRYIIIDEVHNFMSSERGIQLQSILERIQRQIGKVPVRIGLSATLGDYSSASRWLSNGTNRACSVPLFETTGRKLRLSVNCLNEKDFFKYLYDVTRNRHCIIFSNSRAEVEENISALRNIANEEGTPDIYQVHHGNISASMREEAEKTMKSGEKKTVTGATLTLELGIDVGDLEMIVQTGSPINASGFVQRLGRSGRRNGISVMYFAFRELYKNDFIILNNIDWELIKCIAIIELYLAEKWIEPINLGTLPYGILLHQTLSHVASVGEIMPAKLAAFMLTITPFKNISQEDFKLLLVNMLGSSLLEKTETGTLVIGAQGETLINNFDFYSVFETRDEYTVYNGDMEIGQVQVLYTTGQTFSLAGKPWKVISSDSKKNAIYVEPINDYADTVFRSSITTVMPAKLVSMMFKVLRSDTEYRYLSESALMHLKNYRVMFNSRNMNDGIMRLADNYILYAPGLGTKEMLYISHALRMYGYENDIYYAAFTPVYILVPDVTETVFREVIREIYRVKPDKFEFYVKIANIGGKFRRYLPEELIRKEYISDYIDLDQKG